ncbi:MAG TPA: hypothetical protein VD970_00225 [Acetobacteraceae bacterium]|nr:hypothetical protein [Acetobacteraceae bacterium]
MRRTALSLTLLGTLALMPAAPALAGSQSSDQNSNCSDGRCTRVDTRRFEDRGWQWGYQRHERWDERPRGYRQPAWDPHRGGHGQEPRRHRRRDRDDD